MESLKVCRIVKLLDEKAVNEHLQLGWELLVAAPGRDVDGTPYIYYSLGWPSERGTPTFPEPKYKWVFDETEL